MGGHRAIFERPSRPPSHWSNHQLDALRQVTDEPADAVISEFFAAPRALAADGASDPHELLLALMNHRVSKSLLQGVSIPQTLLDELARRCPLPAVEPAEIRKGQALFQNHGPEMLLTLCCYSLPMAYGAANGARVLHETGYLENRVTRRLVETTQMVVDVMKPGGLGPNGDGLRTAHEIRLMHAAIRHLIERGDHGWQSEAWGRPINQEDLAGTLMTFSYVVLDGLSKMGIRVDRDAQEAYLAAWCSVGRVMGVHEALLPKDMEQARELTWFIYDRQMRGSKVGRDLIRALLAGMASHLPPFAGAGCASMLRMLMEPKLANELGVPRNLLLDNTTCLMQRMFGAADNLLNLSRFGFRPYRLLSLLVIRAVTLMGRGHDHRARFELPTELHEYWNVSLVSSR